MRVHGIDVDGSRFELSVSDGRWKEAQDERPADLSDFFCLPGLVDAHAHVSADDLDTAVAVDVDAIRARVDRAVASGVLGVIDKGWGDDVVLDLVRDAALPIRAQAAGVMLRSPDGYIGEFGVVVDPSDLAAVVKRLAPNRPWIKIVGDWPRRGQGALPNYDEGTLAAAVSAAHVAGARVAIHTMAPGVASMAVRAGVDSIEHGLFLTSDDLETLAVRDGMWVPTILRMESTLAELRPGSSGAELLGRGLENVRALLPTAADLGLDVLAGSDLAVPVADLAREVAALVRCGLPAGRAIAGASTAGAAAAGFDTGIRVGAPADLVAYRRHPVEDPGTLSDPVFVMQGGSVVTDRR